MEKTAQGFHDEARGPQNVAALPAAGAASNFVFRGRVEAGSQPPNRKRRIDEASAAGQLAQFQTSPEFQHMRQAASAAASARQMVNNHLFPMDYSAVFPVAGGLNHGHHGMMGGLIQPYLAGALGLPFPGAHAAMIGPSVDQLQGFPGAHLMMQQQAAAMAQFQQEQAKKHHMSTNADASLLGMDPSFHRMVGSQNGKPDAVPPDDDDDDDMPPDVTSS